jgi:hypothetical protein
MEIESKSFKNVEIQIFENDSNKFELQSRRN